MLFRSMRGRTEGIASHEGMRGRTEGVSMMTDGYSSKLTASYGEDEPSGKDNPYANVKIDKYTLQDEDEQLEFEKAHRKKLNALKLFDNKNEFVKAVIYSEILTRRTAKR